MDPGKRFSSLYKTFFQTPLSQIVVAPKSSGAVLVCVIVVGSFRSPVLHLEQSADNAERSREIVDGRSSRRSPRDRYRHLSSSVPCVAGRGRTIERGSGACE